MSRIPPLPGLNVAVPSLKSSSLFDPPLQRLDARDVGTGEVAAVDPRLELVEKEPAQVPITGDGPGLDKRLPLPRAARHVVVAQRAFPILDRRPLIPFGAKTEVDSIGHAQHGRLGQQLHDLLGQPVKELDVARPARSRRSGRRRH